VLAYRCTGRYVELTASGYVSADEAAATFRTIRDDPEVPEGLPWLMDVRQYDQDSMSPDDLQARVMKMFALLGSKLGSFWALLIDSQIEHVIRGRLLQRLVQDFDATVMLFRERDEAEEWLEAMTVRRAQAGKSSLRST
jgi:hypothetical protein